MGGDEPLSEVTVCLYDLDNQPVGNAAAGLSTTVTGLDGRYAFTNLPPGNYGVWPLTTADAGGLRFQWETNSASPQMALVAGTNMVNFTAQDSSLFEGGQFKIKIWVVNIPADVDRAGITMDQRRRYWAMCFPGFSQEKAVSRSAAITTNDTPVWKSATFDLEADYGWTCLFWTLDNTFLMRLYDNAGGGMSISEQFLVLPLSGCPENSLFTWDYMTRELKAVEGLSLPGMVWINPGTFMMGNPWSVLYKPDESAYVPFPDEIPQTVVTLTRGFWMSKFETTQGEYKSVMESNPSSLKCYVVPTSSVFDTWPVENVSWEDAVNYCSKLTAREYTSGRLPAGYIYRLPTEAEWEYASRAGTTTQFNFSDYEFLRNLDNYAWHLNGGGLGTHRVGGKKPNAWGLCDMQGNVFEWCRDWYGVYPGGSMTDPRGPTTGSGRVIRGGSYAHSSWYCRSSSRVGYPPDARGDSLGFRPVLATGQ